MHKSGTHHTNGRKQTVTTENVSKLYGKRMLVRPLILIVLLLVCGEWIVYRRRTNSTNRFNKVSTIACRILLFAGLTAAFIGISMSHISDSTTTVLWWMCRRVLLENAVNGAADKR